jgi:hypothetical protein
MFIQLYSSISELHTFRWPDRKRDSSRDDTRLSQGHVLRRDTLLKGKSRNDEPRDQIEPRRRPDNSNHG